MATRLFPDDQMERLKSYPDIGTDELIRFFTLTAAEVAFVDPGRGRGPADRLGLAVQLCTLPWLGFVPDEVRSAPSVAVVRLAGRLGIDPQALDRYGERAQTRTDHLRLVCDYLGWKTAPTGGVALKELEEFLLGRAMEHDSPTTLFNLACEYLVANRTVRPGVVSLLEMVATARATATAVTHDLVAPLLTEQMTADLDLLPRVDAGLGMTRLAWLTKPAVDATATSIQDVDREADLGARHGRASDRPVDAGRGAAPVSGHDRAPVDRAGPGATRRRAPVPDPADPGRAVGRGPAGRGRGDVRPGGLGAGGAGEGPHRQGSGRAG
jgi:hypothetical protein